MNILFIVIGVIALIVSVVSIFSRKGKEKELLTLGVAESMEVGELIRLAKEVGSDETLGSGYFNKDVKISGKIGSDNPLTSEFARVDCVWYSNEVRRVYEVEKTETDSDNKEVKTTEKKEEVVSDRTKETEFWVDDGTGKIYVSLEGLSFDREEIFDQYKPYEEVKNQGFKIRMNDITIDVGGYSSGSRTLGYKYTEKALPIGKQVFITGDAKDADGRLRLYQPQEDYIKYMLKFGTEEELKMSLQKSISTLKKTVFISGAIGIALLIVGVILSFF